MSLIAWTIKEEPSTVLDISKFRAAAKVYVKAVCSMQQVTAWCTVPHASVDRPFCEMMVVHNLAHEVWGHAVSPP